MKRRYHNGFLIVKNPAERPDFSVIPQRQLSHPELRDLVASCHHPNPPRPKAANAPQKQDFAASAIDPMKLAKTKGSKCASEASFDASAEDPMFTQQSKFPKIKYELPT